jgi:hypothetical protein
MSLGSSQEADKKQLSARDSEQEGQSYLSIHDEDLNFSTAKKLPRDSAKKQDKNESLQSERSANSKARFSEECGSGLKYTGQLQKPFSSPMLIASVASVSASSPASGGVTNDYHRYGLETIDQRPTSNKHRSNQQADDRFQEFRSTLEFDKVLEN